MTGTAQLLPVARSRLSLAPPSPRYVLQSLRLAPQSPRQFAAVEVFRREGEYWRVQFRRDTSFVAHVRGMTYLACLLDRPGHEVHVRELVALGRAPRPLAPEPDADLSWAGNSDCGEVLDRRARADYARRLRELRGEIAEAGRRGDVGQAERYCAERDFIAAEYARALGLGGRVRCSGSQCERARVNVTRTLRAAVQAVAIQDAALGEHFDRHLVTGMHCCYAPLGVLGVTHSEELWL